MKYGIEIGQIYVPASGSKNELTVVRYLEKTDDVIVFDTILGVERLIDAFKLAKVRYMLKEK